MKFKILYFKIKIISFVLSIFSFIATSKVFAKNEKSKNEQGESAICTTTKGTLDVLAELDVCAYQDSQKPVIELLTTSMQGDIFDGKKDEKWAKWTMDQNANVGSKPTKGLYEHLNIREEKFGGLLINTKTEAVYKLNPRAYFIMKMLISGHKNEDTFCNTKEGKDFIRTLQREGLIEKKKNR